MADKVKPLGFENALTGGSESLPLPTELDPTEDYISAKGLSLEHRDDALLHLQNSSISFTDPLLGSHPLKSLHSLALSFVNGANVYIQTNSTTYQLVARFIYRGTLEVGSAASCLAGFFMSASGTTGDIRLYDVTGATVIGEMTGISTTDTSEITSLSCANWPSTSSIIEIHLRRTSGNGSVRLSSLSLEW